MGLNLSMKHDRTPQLKCGALLYDGFVCISVQVGDVAELSNKVRIRDHNLVISHGLHLGADSAAESSLGLQAEGLCAMWQPFTLGVAQICFEQLCQIFDFPFVFPRQAVLVPQ